MDVRSIFGSMRAAIQDSEPSTWPDRNFSTEPHSLVAQPEDWIQLQSRNLRDFCIRITGFPLSVNAYCYSSLDVEVMVYYPHSVATDEMQCMLVEDCITIQSAIGRHPEAWGGADSISCLSLQPYIWTTVTDDNSDPIATVLAIPFRIEVKTI